MREGGGGGEGVEEWGVSSEFSIFVFFITRHINYKECNRTPPKIARAYRRVWSQSDA